MDPEFVALLADTQNACLEELGYSSTLLAEFQELKKGCAALQKQRVELQNYSSLLRADNTKLYADNRSLATFIQQQDQRMKLLQDPSDQQKSSITDLHENVRRLTNERDELAGRLHAAYVFALLASENALQRRVLFQIERDCCATTRACSLCTQCYYVVATRQNAVRGCSGPSGPAESPVTSTGSNSSCYASYSWYASLPSMLFSF